MSSAARDDLVRLSVVTAARAAFVLVIGGVALIANKSMDSSATRDWLGLAATVLVAASVMASRSWVERIADTVAYGPNSDPYSTLSSFVRRISETVAVDEVLPQVAQTVTQATHSSTSEVRLWLQDGAELREAWPIIPDSARATMVNVPLQRRGEQVGVLGVAAGAAPMTGNTKALLDRLAGAAGLALANVRLVYDLRHEIAASRELADRVERSRQRLLDAAAEQTERFSHHVDDQVQGQLQAVEEALGRAERGDGVALEKAAEHATTALEALRDIAAGVFPPTLADNGLRVALETYALRYAGRARVTHRGREDRFPASVEAAAYFCSVQVIDDQVKSGSSVGVEIEQLEHSILIHLTSDGAPTPATMQLVDDRVEATDGVLDRRTAGPSADRGAGHELLLSWDLVAS
jgi:hypothetical protein